MYIEQFCSETEQIKRPVGHVDKLVDVGNMRRVDFFSFRSVQETGQCIIGKLLIKHALPSLGRQWHPQRVTTSQGPPAKYDAWASPESCSTPRPTSGGGMPDADPGHWSKYLNKLQQ